MRRLRNILLLCAAFALLLPGPVRAEKASRLPDWFQIEYKAAEHTLENDKKFVSKDQITTCQSQVDSEINALADAFEAEQAPLMKANSNPQRNARLDIHIVHSVSGHSAMSFLVLARESYNRKQQQSPCASRVYDMETGERIFLTDLMDEDSEGWDLLAEAVFEGLGHYFPGENCDTAALNALCARDALLNTAFALEPACLTLYWEARTLYPDHPALMRVSVPYRAMAGMLTDYGVLQTDNSMYKMVALTFDDGPAYGTTATLLNNLRRAGAKATFFLVGDRIGEYEDITLRENDEGHSLQSHHFKHTDTTKSTPARIQAYTERFYNTLTALTGQAPRMLRPPYGLDEPFVQARVNLPIIQWDVDTKDWTGKSSQGVLGVVKSETRDGSIILMHDIKDNTPESGKLAAEWLRENGYLCVRVEDLFLHYGVEMEPNHVYYSVPTENND